MEKLRNELDGLLTTLPNAEAFRASLDTRVCMSLMGKQRSP